MSEGPWSSRITAAAAGAAMARMQAEAATARAEQEANLAQVKRLRLRFPSPEAGKCACCGSREFRPHHGRSVCAYCRGNQ